MNPQIATLVYAFGILVLFALARDRKVQTSKALWIPIIWLLIGGSRNVSEWLGGGTGIDQESRYENRYMEGNSLDRNVLTGLLVLGVLVLLRRRPQVGALMRANAAIVLYFSYCAASILWSGYPDVAFKRWIRGLGDLVMVLVVLTDGDRLAALKRLLTRAGFLLVPISILLIRYYPEQGRTYSRWSGMVSWTGVNTDKNGLGLICMIFGLASVWHLLQVYRGKADTHRAGPLIAHGAFVAMVLWLFLKADSATSIACFFLASVVMGLTSQPALARKPAFVHLLVAAVLSVAVSALFLNTGTSLVESMGRDSTITGRTDIWGVVIGMVENPLLGSGFESFWLGDRLEKIARVYYNHPNQAHNGYIEVFLNLGWAGVALLVAVLLTGHRNVVAAVRRQAEAGTLGLAYFVVIALYNLTEGAFKMMHPAWVVFLLSIIVVPAPPAPEARHQRTDPSLLYSADRRADQNTPPIGTWTRLQRNSSPSVIGRDVTAS